MTAALASLFNVHALIDGNPITSRKPDDLPAFLRSSEPPATQRLASGGVRRTYDEAAP